MILHRRCARPTSVERHKHFCGLPAGHPWPHRYIERSLSRRLVHEIRLLRYRYTDFDDLLMAVFFGRAVR